MIAKDASTSFVFDEKHGRMPRRPAAPRGADPDVAWEAARALHRLLCDGGEAAWGAVPPEPAAAALLGAMRRHPGEKYVQFGGCAALHELCEKFPALRGALRRDASVLATVQRAATVRPDLENREWYTQKLCVWLEPCLGECGTVVEPLRGGKWEGPFVPSTKPKEVAQVVIFAQVTSQINLNSITAMFLSSHLFVHAHTCHLLLLYSFRTLTLHFCGKFMFDISAE